MTRSPRRLDQKREGVLAPGGDTTGSMGLSLV